ncbi:MAG: hypothetical protein JST12_19245 [Armatimonadetes bacterium]|nr:hypothetical protein [Armatimonadota bacterium]
MKTILALSALVLIGCGRAEPPLPTGGATLTVTSGSFGTNQEIPGKFSKEGGNVSPSLSWSRPPSGTHHYFFHVFALDTKLSLAAGASKADVAAAMKSHVLASGAMVGLFTHR